MKSVVKIRFLLSALLIALLVAGCGAQPQDPQTQPPTEAETAAPTVQKESSGPVRRSNLKVELEDGSRASRVEDLNGQYDGKIFLADGKITIPVDGVDMPLADAIRSGEVAVETLIADAKIDARNGFCQAAQFTKNGFTSWTYTYPEYQFVAADDVLEAPDGNEYHYQDFTLYGPGEPVARGPVWFMVDGPDVAYPLDREDWGLTVQVSKADTEGVTLALTQTGGQQAGKLVATRYRLLSRDKCEWVTEGEELEAEVPLAMEGTTELTIPFAAPVEPGEYSFYLEVWDRYAPEDLHPLQNKFHDAQQYLLILKIK